MRAAALGVDNKQQEKMKKKAAKDYLLQIPKLDQEINALLEEVEKTRELAERTNAAFSQAPAKTNTHTSVVERSAIELVELNIKANAMIGALVDLKREAMKLISGLDKQEHRILLTLRYIRNKLWTDIALDMQYDESHVYEIHNCALLEVGGMLACKDPSKSEYEVVYNGSVEK